MDFRLLGIVLIHALGYTSYQRQSRTEYHSIFITQQNLFKLKLLLLWIRFYHFIWLVICNWSWAIGLVQVYWKLFLLIQEVGPQRKIHLLFALGRCWLTLFQLSVEFHFQKHPHLRKPQVELLLMLLLEYQDLVGHQLLLARCIQSSLGLSSSIYANH